MDIKFAEFSKIPRLTRGCVITEKIDGTNACISIIQANSVEGVTQDLFLTGSRTRWIVPGDDNYGFALWASKNREELTAKLGYGTHYGEWWGSGIQRGYGLTEKRFSLFNTHRWGDPAVRPSCCHVVPVIASGDFTTILVDQAVQQLRHQGSVAAPGFMKPEGVVVFHTAGNLMFKKTLAKDNEWKPKSADA